MNSITTKLRNLDWLQIIMAISLVLISAVFRFGIPTEPRNQLVFDENYFIPQTESYMVNRFFNDPHGIVGRIPLYIGHVLANPDYKEKLIPENLGDKSDEKYQVTLNLDGARFFPKLIGSTLALLVFILCSQIINWKGEKPRDINGYLIPYLGGLLIAFENGLILDSRIAMLSQPMFFFMLLTPILAIAYYKSRGRLRSLILFFSLILSIGLTMGTKMVAYSVIPFALLLVGLKEYFGLVKFGTIKRLFASTIMVAIVTYLAFIVFLGTFIWHFEQIKFTSPAAHEVVESYKQDLQNGTNNTSFLTKYLDWQQRSLRYQQYVPELDYAKDDEIGSMWITWPIMARPIIYWNQYNDDTTQFQGIITISNPVTWFGGTIGVMLLTSMLIARVFGAQNRFQWRHLFILSLYFANWLPFALINRVMYIYHYYPALIFSVVVVTVMLHDFVIPRMAELSSRIHLSRNLRKVVAQLNWQSTLRAYRSNQVEWLGIMLFLILLCTTVIGFYIYAPFTYKLPLGKAEFESRMLLKEWNVKWKGKE